MKKLTKQFLGFSLKIIVIRIILALLLLLIVTYIIAISGQDVRHWGYGWPLYFLEVWESSEGITDKYSFYETNLILDILFWYLVVCFLANFMWKKKED